MKEEINPVFGTDFMKTLGKTKFFKTLKIAVSERVSEICQKNNRFKTHFSLFAILKITTYELPQKSE